MNLGVRRKLSFRWRKLRRRRSRRYAAAASATRRAMGNDDSDMLDESRSNDPTDVQNRLRSVITLDTAACMKKRFQ
jgi:hypothetical protein